MLSGLTKTGAAAKARAGLPVAAESVTEGSSPVQQAASVTTTC